MKKDFRKIYWIIAIAIGVIASICAVGYAISFDKAMPIEEQSTAMMFWNIAYWSVMVLFGASIVICTNTNHKRFDRRPKETNGYLDRRGSIGYCVRSVLSIVFGNRYS